MLKQDYKESLINSINIFCKNINCSSCGGTYNFQTFTCEYCGNFNEELKKSYLSISSIIPYLNKDNVDKDDVDFNDELTGNEDSVDDDLSYETDLPLDQSDSEDYEVDYVTTEDEFNNVTEEEVNVEAPTTEPSQTEDYSEAIDVVPVTQELVQSEATYTPYGADAVEQAVNEMAEGNDVSLVFNAQTGEGSDAGRRTGRAGRLHLPAADAL